MTNLPQRGRPQPPVQVVCANCKSPDVIVGVAPRESKHLAALCVGCWCEWEDGATPQRENTIAVALRP